MTAEKKALFLETLAETCSVKAAAEAAGIRTAYCYRLKLKDAAFAAEWQDAIAIGYAQVEERLILDATGRAANDDDADGGAPGRMDKYEREQALNLLKYHREEAIFRTTSRRGPAGGLAAEDETDRAILARLAIVRKRLGR
ncbi:MAG TPA: hypothetical protein VKI45_01225 [Allosphingosinicella sp.]|nr:hypothetical protein [Allosphingosinicella sp.]